MAKVMIKDKFTGKLVALKLKEETKIARIMEILRGRYEHLKDKNVALFYKDKALDPTLTLDYLVMEFGYTENDRLEIRENLAVTAGPPKPSGKTAVRMELDLIKMMSKGGKDFDQAVMEILIQAGVMSREIAEQAMKAAETDQVSFVTTLIEGAYLAERDILTTISRQLEIPSVDLEGVEIPPNVLKLVPQDVASYYCIIPTHQKGSVLSVAVTNPFDAAKLDDLRLITGLDIDPVLSTEPSIREKIKTLYESSEEKKPTDEGKQPKVAIRSGQKVDPTSSSAMKGWDAPTVIANEDGDTLTAEPVGTDMELESIESPGLEDFSNLDGMEEEVYEAIPQEEAEEAMVAEPLNEDEADQLPLEAEEEPQEEESYQEEPQEEESYQEEPQEEESYQEEPQEEESYQEESQQEDLEEASSPITIAPVEETLPEGEEVDITPAAEVISDEEGEGEVISPDLVSSEEEQEVQGMVVEPGENEEEAQFGELAGGAESLQSEELAKSLGMTEEEIALEREIQSEYIDSDSGEEAALSPEDGVQIPKTQEELFDSSKETQPMDFDKEVLPEQEEPLAQGVPVEEPASLDIPSPAPIPDEASKEEAYFEDESAPASMQVSTEAEDNVPLEPPPLAGDIVPSQPPISGEPTPVQPVSGEHVQPQPPVEELQRPTGESVPKPTEERKEAQVLETAASAVEEKPQTKTEISGEPMATVPKESKPEEEKPAKKELTREATVRYYSQMHPFQTYPLMAVLSKRAIQKVVGENVAQVSGKKITIPKEKPIVKVVPHFPGCITVPSEVDLDVTPKVSSTKIWVTPLAEGKIPDARVELWHEGRCIDMIFTPTKVVKHTMAKVSAFCGILSTVLCTSYDLSGFKVEENIPYIFIKALETINMIINTVGGITNLGLILAGFFLFVAGFFLFKRRAYEGNPVINFFDLKPEPEAEEV